MGREREIEWEWRGKEGEEKEIEQRGVRVSSWISNC
jgi:hypothetical protein